MTFPSQGQIDVIATQIRLDAKAALVSLKAWNNSVTDAAAKTKLLQEIIKATAQQMNGDFAAAAQAVNKFSKSLGLNPAVITKIGKDLQKVDKMAQQSLGNMSKNTVEANARMSMLANGIAAMAARGKMSIDQVVSSLRTLNASSGTRFGKLGFTDKDIVMAGQAARQLGQDLKNAGNAGKQAGQTMEDAFKRTLSPINAVRIALGAIVAMIVFQVVQAFGNLVRGAMKGLVEIESAMFNIVNAEKRLSEQGIDIDTKSLDELIKKLQILNPMLSRYQATELVSALTTKVAPALGLGLKEIDDLSESIAILAVRNQALGKSFEEVEQQVITGLLSGKVTAGINQLGVKITDQIVKEEALRLRLVASAEAYDELNAKEQERINALSIISILQKNTAQEAESLPVFLQTASGLIATARARLQDILTDLGQKFAPVLKTIFTGIIDLLEIFQSSLVERSDAWNTFVMLVNAGAKGFFLLAELALKAAVAIGELGNKLFTVLGQLPGFKRLVELAFPESEFPDTPTGIPTAETDATGEGAEKQKKIFEKYQDDLTEIMEDAQEKRLDLERDYQRKLEDIARDYANKLTDIARDASQKREDALRDLNQRLEDIERDYNNAVEEAQEEHRKKEEDREQEYQNRLRELREKFLFDLEDALRERDARQVLRLIRQYNMDKKNLEERRKLEEEEAAENLQNKLKELEEERKQKIENARREYEEKLAEIAIGEERAREEANIWRRRQLEDARTWHQRQLEEQREYLQRKLQDLAQALAEEYNMTASTAQAIANLLGSLLGTGINIPIGTSPSPFPGFSTPPYQGGLQPIPGLFDYYGAAEGGTLIAKRPTGVVFGDRGAEAATFTPLNRAGRDVGKVFGDVSSFGAGGVLNLGIALSEGLVAEIVDTSLEQVSTHIEQVRRQR